MTGSWLIVREDAMREDQWTYGNWRQYVAFLGEERVVCCRRSELPVWFAVVGAVLLLFVAMVVLIPWQQGAVQWHNVFVMAVAGFALMGPGLVQWLTPWRLVVIVGTTKRNDDGSWRRVFDWEDDA